MLIFYIKLTFCTLLLLIKVNVVLPTQAQCFTVKCALPRNKCVILLVTTIINGKQ